MASYCSFPAISCVTDPGISADRLLCLDRDRSLLINGNSVYLQQHSIDEADAPVEWKTSTANVTRCKPFVRSSISSADIDFKDGTSVLQSLSALKSNDDKTLISIVDGFGRTYLNSFDSKSTSVSDITSGMRCTAQMSKPSSWAASSICSLQSVVSTQYYSRMLSWSDVETGATTRNVSVMNNPTALCGSGGMRVLADGDQDRLADRVLVGEGGSVSMWDHRQGEHGGCSHKEQVSTQTLWSVVRSKSTNHEIMVAGADRNVYIYDTRNWKSLLRWKSPCKFDIIKLIPTVSHTNVQESIENPANRRAFYMAGLDNEVYLCDLTTSAPFPPAAPKIVDWKKSANSVSVEGEAEGGATESTRKRRKMKKMQQCSNAVGEEASFPLSDSTVPAAGTTPPSSAPVAVPHDAAFSKLTLTHNRGVRADARWAGMDVYSDSSNSTSTVDTLFGLCDLGNGYIVRNANYLPPLRCIG